VATPKHQHLVHPKIDTVHEVFESLQKLQVPEQCPTSQFLKALQLQLSLGVLWTVCGSDEFSGIIDADLQEEFLYLFVKRNWAQAGH